MEKKRLKNLLLGFSPILAFMYSTLVVTSFKFIGMQVSFVSRTGKEFTEPGIFFIPLTVFWLFTTIIGISKIETWWKKE